MKKPLLLLLTGILLLSSFASCSSCSRRGQYEDQLESQKVAESLDAIPETNGNITGDNAPDYETPVVLKTGTVAYYEGKTVEELRTIYNQTSKDTYEKYVTPTGRLYQTADGRMLFYNKITGNFSPWCSDPLCLGGEDCMWTFLSKIDYIGEEYIYFTTGCNGDFKLYRCDHQRNHIELLIDIYETFEQDFDSFGNPDGGHIHMDEVTVLYDKGNMLYYMQSSYNDGNRVSSVCAMDMNSQESTVLSGNLDLELVTIVQDTVFYTLDSAPYDYYKTDLTFSSPKLIWQDVSLVSYNHEYAILNDRSQGESDIYFAYNLKTGEKISIDRNGYLYGNYVYYMRTLTEDEIATDPLKDYYGFRDPLATRDTVQQFQSKRAGKIYRQRIDVEGAEEECVFQLTYKDIPVRLRDIELDGQVIYFSYWTYEEYVNYYNQDFSEDEYDLIRYGMVDLQSGSVMMLEIPQTE